jgi:Short C-terminal domain
MPDKLVVKPGKPAGVFAVVAGAIFLVFGLAILILAGRDTSDDAIYAIYVFGILWVIVCGIIIIIGVLNMRKEGIEMLRIEGGDISATRNSGSTPDQMDRLRKLDALKKDGLISEEEFRAKREEIMREKW